MRAIAPPIPCFKQFVTDVNPSEYYTELERDFEIAAGTGKDGFGNTDALRNLEDIIGTRFEDILIGNEKDNRIWALEGNDLLTGLKQKIRYKRVIMFTGQAHNVQK